MRIAIAPFEGVETLRPALQRLGELGLPPSDMTVLARRSPGGAEAEAAGLRDYLLLIDGHDWPEGTVRTTHAQSSAEWLKQSRDALVHSMVTGPARLTEEWNEKWRDIGYILVVTVSSDEKEHGIQRILLDYAVDRVDMHDLTKPCGG